MLKAKLHINSFLTFFSLFFLLTIVFSQNLHAQHKEVIAKKGDGIYSLLKRHGYSISKSMNSFITLNKASLSKNNTLIAGKKYKLPLTKSTKNSGTKKTAHYKILGKKYADIDIKSTQLKGAVYYLMAGHGGPDPGAIGRYNNKKVHEDEYAYDVILRLARNLIAEGATVYLITKDKNDGIRDAVYLKPDKDEVCYPNQTIPLNQVKRLRQRTNAVNKLYKKHKGAFQRMISIHIDSRSKRENIDIFFYHDKRSKTGKKTANILRKTIEAKYRENQPGRGYTGTVSTRNLYVIKHTWPTAIFIELGNMNHQRDVKRLVISDNRQAVANWLALGLKKDFKTNK